MVVIPNAVITPSVLRKKQARSDKIRIVIVGRLVYRRGVDLLLQILPIFCERNKNEAYVL
jgi:glycosyltransferase involved in cell wall biosynthesis